MNTITQRLEKLESQVAQLLGEKEWYLLPDAALALNRSTATLRRRIKEAKKDPKSSPYKKGIHWREFRQGKNRFYEVKVQAWRKVMQKNDEN